MKEKTNNKKDLEESLLKLEKIVQELEKGNLPLDEGLDKFEVGVRLYKDCKQILSEAEKKIQVLTDSLNEEDFDCE